MITTFKTRSRAAASGNGLVYPSSVGFGETNAVTVGAFYRAQRDQNGWTSESIMPPIASFSQFTAAFGPVAVSSELTAAVQHANVDADGNPLENDAGEPLAGGSLLFENLDTSDRSMIFVDDQELTPGNIANTPMYSSDDLKTIFFQSNRALSPGAIEGQLYVYKHENGQTTLASIGPDGNPIPGRLSNNGQGGLERVSESGDVVYFDAGGALYRRDALGTVPVNTSESGDPAGAAELRTISSDGSKALFTSPANLVDADSQAGSDLYLYIHSDDPENDENLHLISVDEEPTDGTSAEVKGILGASEDLTRVYFAASGQLVAGAPTAAANKLYLWTDGPDGGSLEYIGGVGNGSLDAEMWQSQDNGFDPRGSSVSGSGRYVLARTTTSLSGDDNGGFPQIYRFDASSGEWDCASCRTDGTPTTGGAQLRESIDVVRLNRDPTRNLSSEGHVFFETAVPLVADDINDKVDVYVWKDGVVDLISSGRSTEASRFLDADEDGSNVFFSTRERLTRWDLDDARDAYTARIDGGLPAPGPGELDCIGDACQGDPTAPPEYDGPGSDGVFPGNPAPKTNSSRCSKLDKRSKRVKQKSRQLKRKASKADSRRRTKRLQARAVRQMQKSKRLERRAMRCRGASR